MVSFEEEKKVEFPKDKLGSSIFLSSLRDLQKDNRVEMGVEKVSKLFANKNDADKCRCAVQMSILGDFPECRVFVIDDNNEYVTKIDDMTGNEVRMLEKQDVSGEIVTFYLNLKLDDPSEPLNEETVVAVHKMASAYPLIRAGFVSTGELDENSQPTYIKCNWQEMKDALEGLTFTGVYKHIDGTYKYDMLDVILE